MTTLTKAAREALEACETALRQFTKTPSTLADSTARGNAHAALAALRAALSEAPGESAELPPLPECYVTSGGRDLWSEEQVIEYATRAMLAARPEAPQGEPVAEIVGGILRWHIPDAGWALPQQYLRGVHLLYARTSAPKVALTDEQIGDCIRDARASAGAFARDGTTSERIARAAIAKFCEVNGLAAPEAGKEGGA